MKKKKIAYVVNVDWFFISHRLPLALEALKRGYEVFLITKDTGYFNELKKKGINCIGTNFKRSGINIFGDFKLIFDLRNVYKKIDPDIIHQVTLKPCIYGTLAARSLKLRARMVNAISGFGYSFTGKGRTLEKFILITLLKITFKGKKSYFIFQNSDDQLFCQNLKLINSNNHVIIKGSGVDENVFFQKDYSRKNDKVRIVLVSRMLKDKGIFEFIKAAELLRGKYFLKYEFFLIGGIDIENLSYITEEKLKSLTDGFYIQWLGHQTDIKNIFSSADIVCLPSYREGLPRSLVEAMAVGCPIITTDAIGCRECVEDGDNGYLVPIGDFTSLAKKIEELGNNEELRIKMGRSSRLKMLKEMSLSKVVEKTFNFYNYLD